ncbi:excinuclease ABC subunit A [Paenibacillus sp. H1-7]|uniref:excinuclease ABC subunit UvrA n=1 Tax=Paenibacillus sp. H1-7 TaxID=2282849 RepID=UPI001EF7B653|nr:excinuclease ABC subunit UvrA [Paenibacillus sp. H1-7]ULL16290.1 excinuclease ABC subunit A [Paenibacillus sp. H1-7]
MKDAIVIKGAHENNLKHVSLSIPKFKLVVVTGPSGSGKSTLAMDTLQRECQRQYMESMGMVPDSVSKPKVESIEGLSPSISIGQHVTNRNPRSTVGTVTDIYTYLRFVYSRLGQRICPGCKGMIPPSFQEPGTVMMEEEESRAGSITCPHCLMELEKFGMAHFSFNKPEGACEVCSGLGNVATLIMEAVFNPELSLRSGGVTFLYDVLNEYYSSILLAAAKYYGFSFDPDMPLKDYNDIQRDVLYYGVESPEFLRHYPDKKPPKTVNGGKFEGIITGIWRRYKEKDGDQGPMEREAELFRVKLCTGCQGGRLKKEVRQVTVAGASLSEVAEWPLEEVLRWTRQLRDHLPVEGFHLLEPVLHDVPVRLERIMDVGLGYLSLHRQTVTLSGGEAQRLRLASLLGSGLTGVLYILDEPTTGLHPRDTAGLIRVLKQLRDLGNTVLVIEHDVDVMRAADHIIDVGPGAGRNGGTIVGQGSLEELMDSEHSVTGAYLRNEARAVPDRRRRQGNGRFLTIRNAHARNLKHIDVSFPLGSFISVTGVSGSGKSTLLFDLLAQGGEEAVEGCDGITGFEHIGNKIIVDQSPIGRMQRSNVATYTDVYTQLRNLYAGLPEAKRNKLTSKHFSFNTPGGRCEACQGLGVLPVEMNFLPSTEITCPACKGRRFNEDVLKVKFEGYSISDLLNLTVQETLPIFQSKAKIYSMIELLCEVGLGYLQWGQSVKTLSGGEGQRIKLAKELSKKTRTHTLYLLDEPTTGLHPTDVKRLHLLLDKLVDAGNTVIVVEHSLELIREADWVIDIGPDGGTAGGELVAEGTPEQVANNRASATGNFLSLALAGQC